jgi:hypothetical protein
MENMTQVMKALKEKRGIRASESILKIYSSNIYNKYPKLAIQ